MWRAFFLIAMLCFTLHIEIIYYFLMEDESCCICIGIDRVRSSCIVFFLLFSGEMWRIDFDKQITVMKGIQVQVKIRMVGQCGIFFLLSIY